MNLLGVVQDQGFGGEGGGYIYSFDATPEEIATAMGGYLSLTRSNENTTVAMTVTEGLEADVNRGAIPAGIVGQTCVRFDHTVSGRIDFDLVLPVVAANNDPGGPENSAGYSLTFGISNNALTGVLGFAGINARGNGVFNLFAISGELNESDLNNITPPTTMSIVFDHIGPTFSVLFDDEALLEDAPYTPGQCIVSVIGVMAEGITDGGDEVVSATITYTLPVNPAS
jgi:hypothetical protein